MVLHNWGPQSGRETLLGCAMAADWAGIDSLWLTEHLGMAPDPKRDRREPAAARALEPTTTLPFIAQVTRRIHLGVAVLVLPFRPPLLLARWAATMQDLSRGRLELGVGLGWKAHEFMALGLDVDDRERQSDEALVLLRRSFREDVVEWNGQSIVSNPRPEPPPVYVGGAPEDAFDRALEHADGWLATGMDPENLGMAVARLRDLAAGEDRKRPAVVSVQTLPVREPAQAADLAAEYAEAGVDQLIHASSYETADEFKEIVAVLAGEVRPGLS
jgi:probable F420-dependent oxidoreductase